MKKDRILGVLKMIVKLFKLIYKLYKSWRFKRALKNLWKVTRHYEVQNIDSVAQGDTS